MNVQQIKKSILSGFQHFISESFDTIAVGELSESDWVFLSRGYGELFWDHGLTTYGNSENKFDVVFKTLPCPSNLDAVILGVYEPDAGILEVHFIESFVRASEAHPLCHKVMMLSVVVMFLFISAAGGTEVRLVDTNEELVDFYSKFGFKPIGGDKSLSVSASYQDLCQILSGIIQKISH